MSNHPTTLFDLLFKVVEALGFDRTKQLLLDAQFEKVGFTDPVAAYVVTKVAEKFSIPIAEIIHGTGRKNDRKYAIGFCAHYLAVNYEYDMDQVAEYLKKDLSLCHKYSRMIPRLNEKHVSDKKYLEFKQEFDLFFSVMPPKEKEPKENTQLNNKSNGEPK